MRMSALARKSESYLFHLSVDLNALRFFAENPAVFDPVKVSANQQFGHFGVVRVFHRHGFGFKAMSFGKCPQFNRLCMTSGKTLQRHGS